MTSRSCLVFENLVALGYQSGLPGDKLTAAMFVRAFERVVVELHGFRIGHGDLYATNLWWRLDPSTHQVLVTIVDWDSGFFLCDGVPENWAARWSHTPKWRLYARMVGDGHPAEDACRAADTYFVSVLKLYLQTQRWDKWLLLATSKDPNLDLKKLVWDDNCINRLSSPGDECCDMHAALGH